MQRQEQTHYQSWLPLPFLGTICKKWSTSPLLFLQWELYVLVGTQSTRRRWPPVVVVACLCVGSAEPAGRQELGTSTPHTCFPPKAASPIHISLCKTPIIQTPAVLLLAPALQTRDPCCRRLLLSALTILWNFSTSECNFPSQLSASDHFFSNFSLVTAKMA